MPTWSANDDPTGRPNYANTANVFGVDRTEALVYGKGVSPGWVAVRTGSGQISGFTINDGGTGYVTADTIEVNGAVNAVANLIVGEGPSLAGIGNLNIQTGNVIVVTNFTPSTELTIPSVLYAYVNATGPAITLTINEDINATAFNVASAPSVTNSAVSNWGYDGVITGFQVTEYGSFTVTDPESEITTSTGSGANVDPIVGGRAGRVTTENMVFIHDVTNDADDDGTFPDS